MLLLLFCSRIMVHVRLVYKALYIFSRNIINKYADKKTSSKDLITGLQQYFKSFDATTPFQPNLRVAIQVWLDQSMLQLMELSILSHDITLSLETGHGRADTTEKSKAINQRFLHLTFQHGTTFIGRISQYLAIFLLFL